MTKEFSMTTVLPPYEDMVVCGKMLKRTDVVTTS
jgi:hypothetical protein